MDFVQQLGTSLFSSCVLFCDLLPENAITLQPKEFISDNVYVEPNTHAAMQYVTGRNNFF
jgi:hypothetical protein